MSRRKLPAAPTERERFENVFNNLAAAGVAYWFDLRGATGVAEDRYHDYMRAADLAGTDRWVGEHVGNVDCGGAYWGDDGLLYGGRRPNGTRYGTLYFSHNFDYPDLGVLLERLFLEQGINAWNPGNGDSVVVTLGGDR